MDNATDINPALPNNYKLLFSEMERLMAENRTDVPTTLSYMNDHTAAKQISYRMSVPWADVINFVDFMFDGIREREKFRP
jgi:hypothetical protein